MKEKIGIEKLIELLNERIKEGWKPYGDYYSITKIDEIWKSDGLYFVSFVGEDYPGPVNLEHILTKQAGLIKWLVENDKIEREKFGNSETKSSKYSDFELSYNTPREDYTNILLMELAIQDEPILFLIGMLR